MDELTAVLLLGGTALGIALVTLGLQLSTMRRVKALSSRLPSTSSPAPEPPAPVQREIAPPAKKSMETLLRRHSSIEESLRAFSELNRLEGFTLATRDGLVVSSTYADATEDAATYSYMANQGQEPGESGVQILRIPHKSTTLVGIVRSREGVDGEKLELMKGNVIKILNHWL